MAGGQIIVPKKCQVEVKEKRFGPKIKIIITS